MISLATALVAVQVLAPARTLSLDEALRTAAIHQPQLRQALAAVQVQQARSGEVRALLLPQVQGTALYQRATSNYAPRPGAVPSSINMSTSAGFETFNYFSFGVSASQTVWDFGGTYYRWKQQEALAHASADSARAVAQSVAAGVRVAYFAARAQKSLVEVARETLANQVKHLQQIEGFVKVGTRPEIDLAQARTDRANAEVQVIAADNGYLVTKAQLNQAMGIEAGTDYDVSDDSLGVVEGEDAPLDLLLAEAVKARPDLKSQAEQIVAQRKAVDAAKGAYGPTISVSTGLTDAGVDPGSLAWNWSATAQMTWPIFQGLLTYNQVKEQKAQVTSAEAQLELGRLQVRLEVEQAQLGVRAARAQLGAAGEALTNARERLRLAEGRYQAGVGSVIELGDAQVALTNAAAQKVQALYNLATARAQLLRALGRG